LDAPGTLHHVIVRGIEKKPIVKDDSDRADFVDRMGQVALESKTPVYAWALMTNHSHILLRSGPKGLSGFMRRFLTSYAGSFNRRHRRHGHLFQNRYKSIICDEDNYFMELVRYIHLNPLRAGLVRDMAALDRYPWCGHSGLMAARKHDWHHADDALAWFGKSAGAARRAYRDYVKEGVSMGRRPDLVGGGLVRSQGGWSNVIAMRKRKVRELADERILGPGDFVERIIEEAEKDFKRSFKNNLSVNEIETLILKTCKTSGIHIDELRSGGRRKEVSEIRSKLAIDLVRHHGVSLAETARHMGVSTSAIGNLLKRKERVS
jgi:REP element-mobilizing transposase RayT/predicted HTH domain antitoxin